MMCVHKILKIGTQFWTANIKQYQQTQDRSCTLSPDNTSVNSVSWLGVGEV